MTSVAIDVLGNRHMAERLIAMPGTGQFDLRQLAEAAAEFGFSVQVATGPRLNAGPQPPRDVAAVLFHRDALGSRCSWFDAIRAVRSDFPGARLIACHGFSEAIDWQLLSDAGVYHALWLPFKDSELRQCLGFLSEAERKAGQGPSASTPGAQRLTAARVIEFTPGFTAAESTAA